MRLRWSLVFFAAAVLVRGEEGDDATESTEEPPTDGYDTSYSSAGTDGRTGGDGEYVPPGEEDSSLKERASRYNYCQHDCIYGCNNRGR